MKPLFGFLTLLIAAGSVTAQVRTPPPRNVPPRPTPQVVPPRVNPKPNVGPKLVPADKLVVPQKPNLKPNVVQQNHVQQNTAKVTQHKKTGRLVPAEILTQKPGKIEWHHMWPKQMGNNLPYRDVKLYPMGKLSHQQLHNAMKTFFRDPNQAKFWRVDPNTNKRVNIYSTDSQKAFTLGDRNRALLSFYKQYEGGRYFELFRKETQRAFKADKLK